MIRIFSRAQNMRELLFGEAGRFTSFVRCQVARDKGTKCSAGKIGVSIELSRLPKIGVVTRCRTTVARGATDLCIDDVAPQANQMNVFGFEVKKNGGNFEAYTNFGVFFLSLGILSRRSNQGSGNQGSGKTHE